MFQNYYRGVYIDITMPKVAIKVMIVVPPLDIGSGGRLVKTKITPNIPVFTKT